MSAEVAAEQAGLAKCLVEAGVRFTIDPSVDVVVDPRVQFSGDERRVDPRRLELVLRPRVVA